MQRTMIEEDRRGRFGDFAIIFLLVGGHRNDESVHISHQLSPSLSSAKLHCGCAPHMASCAAAFSSSSLIGARSGVAIEIGRASGRERVGQYVLVSGVAG